jgi:hypothetical protein
VVGSPTDGFCHIEDADGTLGEDGCRLWKGTRADRRRDGTPLSGGKSKALTPSDSGARRERRRGMSWHSELRTVTMHKKLNSQSKPSTNVRHLLKCKRAKVSTQMDPPIPESIPTQPGASSSFTPPRQAHPDFDCNTNNIESS